MCFSATASFTVSAVLAAVGAATLAGSDRRATHMLAAIPLLFAAQQVSEGVVWLTLGTESLLHLAGTDLFLGFALVVWPTWFPLALLRSEANPARGRLLRRLRWLGLVVSAVGAGLIVVMQPRAEMVAHNIHYDFGIPFGAAHILYLLCYTVPIVAPFMISTVALAPIVGVALLVGLVTTLVVKLTAFTSVWCFFAAISSTLLALGLHRARRTAPPSAAHPRVSETTPGRS